MDVATPPAPRRLESRVCIGEAITTELCAQVVEIGQAAFGRWPAFPIEVSPEDHLRWKLEHPGWEPAAVVLNVADDVVFGFDLRLNRSFLLGGTRHQARDWVDGCVHPKYQGAGLYSRMAVSWKDARAQYDFGVWSTMHPKMVHLVRRSSSNWLELGGRIRAWFWPMVRRGRSRSGGAATRWRRAVLLPAAVAVSRVRRGLGALSPRRGPTPEVRTIDRFDEAIQPVVQGAASGLDFVQERTTAYLNWRYRDLRGGRFTVLAAQRASEPVGFVVVKVAEGVGYVVDIVVLPADEGAREALLDAAVDRLRAEGVGAIVCRSASRPGLDSSLARSGFIDAHLPTGYAASGGRLPLASLDFLVEKRTRMHLMLGDVDWI